MNRLESIRELCGHDHYFLKASYVDELSKIFGLKLSKRLAHSDPPGTFKGLSLFDDNGTPIDKAEGQDADRIACQIADLLKVDYTPMSGRGSALRECCKAVEEHILSQCNCSPTIPGCHRKDCPVSK